MAPERRVPAREILVVAADRDIREALTELLQEDGFAVATAVDSNDALEQLRERGAKLVLVDLKMYVSDGSTLIQLARADASLQSIPMVLVTTMSSHSTSSGEPTPLCKPVDIERIVEVARAYCGRRSKVPPLRVFPRGSDGGEG